MRFVIVACCGAFILIVNAYGPAIFFGIENGGNAGLERFWQVLGWSIVSIGGVGLVWSYLMWWIKRFPLE